jgi:hypothetical protein
LWTFFASLAVRGFQKILKPQRAQRNAAEAAEKSYLAFDAEILITRN